jgi:hypothetical protein
MLAYTTIWRCMFPWTLPHAAYVWEAFSTMGSVATHASLTDLSGLKYIESFSPFGQVVWYNFSDQPVFSMFAQSAIPLSEVSRDNHYDARVFFGPWLYPFCTHSRYLPFK